MGNSIPFGSDGQHRPHNAADESNQLDGRSLDDPSGTLSESSLGQHNSSSLELEIQRSDPAVICVTQSDLNRQPMGEIGFWFFRLPMHCFSTGSALLAVVILIGSLFRQLDLVSGTPLAYAVVSCNLLVLIGIQIWNPVLPQISGHTQKVSIRLEKQFGNLISGMTICLWLSVLVFAARPTFEYGAILGAVTAVQVWLFYRVIQRNRNRHSDSRSSLTAVNEVGGLETETAVNSFGDPSGVSNESTRSTEGGEIEAPAKGQDELRVIPGFTVDDQRGNDVPVAGVDVETERAQPLTEPAIDSQLELRLSKIGEAADDLIDGAFGTGDLASGEEFDSEQELEERLPENLQLRIERTRETNSYFELLAQTDAGFQSECNETKAAAKSADEQREFDLVSAMVRVPFDESQRVVVSHVAFSPPFVNLPEVVVHQVDGSESTIKVTRVETFGVRIEFRQAQRDRNEEQSTARSLVYELIAEAECAAEKEPNST